LSQIKACEAPFELPQGWQWARLDDFNIFENGDRSKNYPSKSILVDKGIPFINAGHLKNGFIDFTSMNYIPKERYDLLRSGKIYQGDILFCLRGSLGKSAIVQSSDQGAIASSLVIIRNYGNIESYYLLYYLFSPLCFQMISKYDNGTAQPNLSATDLKKFIFPLPPLAEQKRIVAKVDQLMALCDTLEQQLQQCHQTHRQLNDSAVHHLLTAENTRDFEKTWKLICDNFSLLYNDSEAVEKLRQAILQLAVQGKLVPQDPKDEPAEKLLEKIQAEKAKLIKEGILKKQETLPSIKDDEIPYALPRGWQWIRLGDITKKIGSGSTPRGGKSVYVDHGIKFLRSQNVYNDGLRLDDVAYITPNVHVKMSGTAVSAGDILLNITGASIARSCLVPDDFDEANVSQHVSIIRPVDTQIRFYLHKCIISPYIYNLIMNVQVGMSREGLSKNKLQYFLIPMPPLAEQKRIVAKVDKLMALCDRLQEQIESARTQAQQLTASTIHHLLAG